MMVMCCSFLLSGVLSWFYVLLVSVLLNVLVWWSLGVSRNGIVLVSSRWWVGLEVCLWI